MDNIEYTKRLEEILISILHDCDTEPDEITKYVVIDQNEFCHKAITAIQQLNNEAIGETEIQVRGITQNKENPMYWTKGTKIDYELRQELREKVRKYCE